MLYAIAYDNDDNLCGSIGHWVDSGEKAVSIGMNSEHAIYVNGKNIARNGCKRIQ